jgi:16S rRNA (cytidine1402-2'-O)-methyltransferase
MAWKKSSGTERGWSQSAAGGQPESRPEKSQAVGFGGALRLGPGRTGVSYSVFIRHLFCFSEAMDAALPPLTASTLYLVATPIGNLEDITLRALRVLRECDVVAAEDTRRSGQLLKHFGISKPLLSYFQFNEARRSEEIIERLRRGEKVALVTDAGSPGISDPGERVVKAAIAAGLRVEAVVGACALVGALTASGLPTEEFHFVGFLPHKSGQRRNKLEAVKTVPGTLVFYESPYRIEKLLGELNEVYPDRDVVLARELTKKFEEFLRGKAAALLAIAQKRSLKGEFVVLVAGATGRAGSPLPAASETSMG